MPVASRYCTRRRRPLPANPAGVLDHMAFSASNLPDVRGKLKTSGIKYDLRKQPDSGVWQLFCFDPGRESRTRFRTREKRGLTALSRPVAGALIEGTRRAPRVSVVNAFLPVGAVNRQRFQVRADW